VGPIDGVTGLLSWPKFYALTGRVAVAFRDGAGRPMAAFSTDGLAFDPAVAVSAAAGAMPALGQFEGSGLAFTYQTEGSGGGMISWVSLSADGLSWSSPLKVSESSSNVHDTTAVRRQDGGLDLYYIYPCSAAGFCLFRRGLSPAGSFSGEQQVTLAEVGETSKPEVARLGDGRLLVLWARISARSPQGYPTEQILEGALIRGDAPR
jgi:hypothetical protein